MSIEKEFKPFLKEKLNQLWHQGFTVFQRYELLGYFDNERLTHVIWKEVQEEWEEFFDEGKANELKVIQDDENLKYSRTFLVVDAERLQEMSFYTKKMGK